MAATRRLNQTSSLATDRPRAPSLARARRVEVIDRRRCDLETGLSHTAVWRAARGQRNGVYLLLLKYPYCTEIQTLKTIFLFVCLFLILLLFLNFKYFKIDLSWKYPTLIY